MTVSSSHLLSYGCSISTLDRNKPNPHLEKGKELENKTYPERRARRQTNLHKIESQDLRWIFLTMTFSPLKKSQSSSHPFTYQQQQQQKCILLEYRNYANKKQVVLFSSPLIGKCLEIEEQLNTSGRYRCSFHSYALTYRKHYAFQFYKSRRQLIYCCIKYKGDVPFSHEYSVLTHETDYFPQEGCGEIILD